MLDEQLQSRLSIWIGWTTVEHVCTPPETFLHQTMSQKEAEVSSLQQTTPNTASNNESSWDYTYYNRVYVIYGYICAVTVPAGIILNSLCVIILLKIRLFKTSVGIHLLWIAVVDLFTIATTLAYSNPLQELLGIPQNKYWGNIMCRLSVSFTYPLSRASSLLITSATFERFLSIAFAFRIKQWPMLKGSKIIVGAIMFICLTECVVWLSIYTKSYCWYSSEVDRTVQFFYMKTYIVIYASTAILVLVFTTLIAIFLVIHQKNMKSMENTTGKTSQSKEARVTLMLFVVAVTFLISTLSEILSVIATSTSESQTQVHLWTAVWAAIVLYDLYHSSNFVIYFIFLAQFRSCFLSCVRSNERPKVTSISNNNSTVNLSVSEMWRKHSACARPDRTLVQNQGKIG